MASTYPTPSQLTALGMVGRTVTDGVRTGVCRMIDGPDWAAAADGTGARLAQLTPMSSWTAPGPIAQVRWHGSNRLDAVPMSDLTRGVTMFKAYGLPSRLFARH